MSTHKRAGEAQVEKEYRSYTIAKLSDDIDLCALRVIESGHSKRATGAYRLAVSDLKRFAGITRDPLGTGSTAI